MGTTKKRIQVLLPSRIHAVVERLAKEMECSQSRVVARLCDEALMTRGEYESTAKQVLDNAGVDFQTTAINTRTPGQPSPWKQMEERVLTQAHVYDQVPSLREEPPETEQEQLPAAVDDDDLKLLKKLKMLKEVGLL